MDGAVVKTLVVYTGLAITIGSYIPYFIGLYRNHLRPHLFSWIIWGLTAGIACAAQLYEGGGMGAWIAGCAFILSSCVVIAAIKKGEKNITRSDWAFFIAALSAIPLWLLTDQPVLAAVLVTIVDILGFGPTIRKSWLQPWQENATIFLCTGLQYIFALIALENYNLTTVVYPAGLVAVSLSFVTILLYRRSVIGQKVQA